MNHSIQTGPKVSFVNVAKGKGDVDEVIENEPPLTIFLPTEKVLR
jgi:hypothetical protein